MSCAQVYLDDLCHLYILQVTKSCFYYLYTITPVLTFCNGISVASGANTLIYGYSSVLENLVLEINFLVTF